MTTTVSVTVGTGTQQWTPPSDCLIIDLIEIWGPGGSGGKRAARVTGGGAGAYVAIPGPIRVSDLITSGTVPYQTGRGGAAQSTATTAGNPGTAASWFYSSTVFSADFGKGGLASGTSGATAGGAGGAVASCIPTWGAKAGGAGGTDSSTTGASSGGASPSAAGNGVAGAAITTGVAGTTTTAPAGGGNGGAASITAANATAGSSPGGGGGAINNASNSSGAGADGQINITYTANNTEVPEAWDAHVSAPSVSLSNSNRTATGTASGSFTTFGLVGKTAGKYYWEISFNNLASTGNFAAGVAKTGSSFNNYTGQNTTSVGWFPAASNNLWYNAAAVASWANYGNSATNLICFALDLDNHKLWGRFGAAGNWNNDVIGNQNPATNTGGYTLNSLVYAAAVMPSVTVFFSASGDVATGNFILGSWSGVAPVGFAPWVAQVPFQRWPIMLPVMAQ